jgi:hypothetical protein
VCVRICERSAFVLCFVKKKSNSCILRRREFPSAIPDALPQEGSVDVTGKGSPVHWPPWVGPGACMDFPGIMQPRTTDHPGFRIDHGRFDYVPSLRKALAGQRNLSCNGRAGWRKAFPRSRRPVAPDPDPTVLAYPVVHPQSLSRYLCRSSI